MGRTIAKVLVTDFDGTLTRRDFFQVFLERLRPPGTTGYWDEYVAGRITHFEALRSIFGSVAPGEPALLEIVQAMKLDPDLRDEVEALKLAGWKVVVASAGCEWYIRRLLAEAGVSLELHANPGRIEDGRLMMELPKRSPIFSSDLGVDKAAIVRAAMLGADKVAFAGDGKPDLTPSLLVPGSLRFARGYLAEELTRLGEDFRPFDRWSEISRELRKNG